MSAKIKKEYYGRDWKSAAGRIGQKLSFILGIVYLIEGIIRIILLSFIYFLYPNTLYILICGILAISGVLLGRKGYENAKFLCLIAGILAIVGLLIFNVILRFILIGINIIFPIGMLAFFINIIFPFILLVGGILSVISKEELQISYKPRRDLKPIKDQAWISFSAQIAERKCYPLANFV